MKNKIKMIWALGKEFLGKLESWPSSEDIGKGRMDPYTKIQGAPWELTKIGTREGPLKNLGK